MKSGRKGFSYIKSLRFFFRRPLAIEKKKGLKKREWGEGGIVQ